MAKFTGKGSEYLVRGTTAYVAVGQVQSIGGITISSDEVEVTTLDAGDYRQYIQGFKDPGECPITVVYDPSLVTHDDAADGLFGLFASGETRDCAIKINSSAAGGNSWLTFQAFVRDWEFAEINPDDPQMATATFRITGPVTIADTAPVVALAAKAA